MRNAKLFAKKFWCDQEGAAAAEYALILAIVGAAIAGAAIILGNAIASAINAAAQCISTAGKTCFVAG